MLCLILLFALSSAEVVWRGQTVTVHPMTGSHEPTRLEDNSPTICDPSVKQHAGYFQLGSSNKKYFYWFFESRSNPSTDPTLMWLTGGPGCSSMLALLVENGPCRVNSTTTTHVNPYSWNEKANAMWVDQPPGTGFSTGAFDHNEDGVARDMYEFLQAFFSAFPQYNQEFHIIGESYAGHYVPAVSHAVWQGNQKGTGIHINMTGIAIGNGLTDPEVQYKYYAKMAYNSTTAPSRVSERTYNVMRAAIPVCVSAITKCNNGKSNACTAALEECNLSQIEPIQLGGWNPYDLRIKCQVAPLCYDFKLQGEYLNTAAVQQALGVSKHWTSCNRIESELFQGDWMHNFQQQLPDLLANGIRVLIYAGDQDFICNWIGNKEWTLAFDWPHKSEFNAAMDKPWSVDGQQAGIIRSAESFTFLQVFKAGHMVPMDQPRNAQAMVNQFMNGDLP